jgi:hypothetical protein
MDRGQEAAHQTGETASAQVSTCFSAKGIERPLEHQHSRLQGNWRLALVAAGHQNPGEKVFGWFLMPITGASETEGRRS